MGVLLLGREREQSQSQVLPADSSRLETTWPRDKPLEADGSRDRSGDGRERPGWSRCRMTWLRLFRRQQADIELQQEIEAHFAAEIAENMARGMSPMEARRQSRIKFGNPQKIREDLWRQ